VAALASQNRARQRPADPGPDDARLDGLEVCKALRARGRNTPILMLTAKITELDRVLGLELGADDYLTKPFSLAELLARVKALLRRADCCGLRRPGAQAAGPALGAQRRAGDPARQAPGALPAARDGFHRAGVRPAAALCAAPGHVFSRAQLLNAVWGYTHDGYEHTVTTHINRLRAKLEADPMRRS
jgi:DNA-binding response OmpR family regulator